jgi:hypothetical protein
MVTVCPFKKLDVTSNTTVRLVSSQAKIVGLTLADAVPVKVTVVTDVSHVMLNVTGIWIRMLLVAVISSVVSSVTVRLLAVVDACPTVKVWFAAEETVADAVASES